jgi:hypothetical protein
MFHRVRKFVAYVVATLSSERCKKPCAHGWKASQVNSWQLCCGEGDGRAIVRPLRGINIITYDVEHLTQRSEPADRETHAAAESLS